MFGLDFVVYVRQFRMQSVPQLYVLLYKDGHFCIAFISIPSYASFTLSASDQSGSESPVVVVLSGSMEPGFKRSRKAFELRVSIPRAMEAVLMYDKDAEVDALVFGPIAERLLRKPAIDCMHYALEGQDGFLHNVNDHLEGENYVFVVRKKRIVRKKQEEDQYVITEIVDVDVDDAPVIAIEDPLVQTVDRGKAVMVDPLPLTPESKRNTLLSNPFSLGGCSTKLDSISTNESVVELISNAENFN